MVEHYPCRGGVRPSNHSRHRSNAGKIQTQRIAAFEFSATEDPRPFLRQVADNDVMAFGSQ